MVVPYALIAERRLIERLLKSNAMSASTAQPLERLRGSERRRLKRLVGAGVIREATADRYYLDAPSLADRMAMRRRLALVAALVAIAAVLLTLAFAGAVK
jgi:hypothetical protein